MKRVFSVVVCLLVVFVFTACGGSSEPSELDWLTVATYAQLEVEDQTGLECEIPVREEEWVVTQSGLYWAVKCEDVTIGDTSGHLVLYQMEFVDDTFESWKVILLQVDDTIYIDNR